MSSRVGLALIFTTDRDDIEEVEGELLTFASLAIVPLQERVEGIRVFKYQNFRMGDEIDGSADKKL